MSSKSEDTKKRKRKSKGESKSDATLSPRKKARVAETKLPDSSRALFESPSPPPPVAPTPAPVAKDTVSKRAQDAVYASDELKAVLNRSFHDEGGLSRSSTTGCGSSLLLELLDASVAIEQTLVEEAAKLQAFYAKCANLVYASFEVVDSDMSSKHVIYVPFTKTSAKGIRILARQLESVGEDSFSIKLPTHLHTRDMLAERCEANCIYNAIFLPPGYFKCPFVSPETQEVTSKNFEAINIRDWITPATGDSSVWESDEVDAPSHAYYYFRICYVPQASETKRRCYYYFRRCESNLAQCKEAEDVFAELKAHPNPQSDVRYSSSDIDYLRTVADKESLHIVFEDFFHCPEDARDLSPSFIGNCVRIAPPTASGVAEVDAAADPVIILEDVEGT